MTSTFDSTLPKCIITGCDFVAGGSVIHGDLHQLGETCIFNACVGEDGEAVRGCDSRRFSDKIVSCPDFPFFERRGIIIFPRCFAEFNQAAKDYLHV